MIAYKAFDKNLQCRGFQYEIGKESGSKGAGYILLEAWCKIRKIKIPEYQSKGDKSKARSK